MTVPAEAIEYGECFRTRTGTRIYLRVAENSVQFFIESRPVGENQEAPAESVYGVCLRTGEITKIAKETLVCREYVGWVHQTHPTNKD